MLFNPALEAWIIPKFPSLGHKAISNEGVKRMHLTTGQRLISTNNNDVMENDELDNSSKLIIAKALY